MNEISELAQKLSALRDARNAAASKTENMVILVIPGSVVVEANQSGLLELARQILLVAANDIDGAHQDFDKAGFASHAEATLTVALNNSLP